MNFLFEDVQKRDTAPLTLSVHAREGYSSHFVCLSLCVSLFYFGEAAVFTDETYISTMYVGDDLSPLNVACFFFNQSYWGKSEWNFSRNCSNVPPLIYSMSSM